LLGGHATPFGETPSLQREVRHRPTVKKVISTRWTRLRNTKGLRKGRKGDFENSERRIKGGGRRGGKKHRQHLKVWGFFRVKKEGKRRMRGANGLQVSERNVRHAVKTVIVFAVRGHFLNRDGGVVPPPKIRVREERIGETSTKGARGAVSTSHNKKTEEEKKGKEGGNEKTLAPLGEKRKIVKQEKAEAGVWGSRTFTHAQTRGEKKEAYRLQNSKQGGGGKDVRKKKCPHDYPAKKFLPS